MKNTSAILTALFLSMVLIVQPTIVQAQATGSGATSDPTAPLINTVSTNQIELDEVYNPLTAISDAVESVSCSESASGGSLTQTLQGLGRQLAGQALDKLGGDQTLGDLLGGVLGGGGGDGIQDQILGALGDEALDYLNDNAKSIIKSLGLGGNTSDALSTFLRGGSITDSVGSLFGGEGIGSIFSGGGGSAISNIAGGALGNVLGGVAGGVLGGGAVPVKAAATDAKLAALEALQDQARALLARIRDDQDTLVGKECVLDVIAKRFGDDIAAQIAAQALEDAQTGNSGEPRYATDSSWELRITDQSMNDFIKNPAIPQHVRTAVYQNYMAQRNPAPAAADCGQGWRQLQNLAFYQCGRSAQQLEGISDSQAKAHRLVQEAARQQEFGNGFFPSGRCTTKPGASYLDCVDAWKIDAPAALGEARTQRAVAAGEEALTRADEAGEVPRNSRWLNLADALMQRGFDWLTTKVLEGDDEDGGWNSGTYLDQVTNYGGRESIETGKGLVETNISNAIAIETQYQSIVQAIITNLNTTIAAYTDVNVCYQSIVTNPIPGVTADMATARAQAALDAVALFDPQVKDRAAELSESQNGLAQLIVLAGEIQGAQTVEGVNAIDSGYGALQDAGFAHTAAELDILTDDLEMSANALDIVQQSAALQLDECQAAQTAATTPALDT